MAPDRVAALVLVCAGAAIVAGALAFYVPYQYEPLGPKVFPVLIGAALALSGIVLALRPGAVTIAADRRHLVVLTALLGYALVYERLGFIVATTLTATLLAWTFGARGWTAAAASAAASIAAFFLLASGLELNLPLGTLWVGH